MRNYFFSWSHQHKDPPFTQVGASGTFFDTKEYGRIFDFTSTSFQSNLGHSFSDVTDAINDQIQSFSIASPKAHFELKEEVSNKLIQHVHLGSGHIFYTQSGAESVENALKMARQIKDRKIILCREQAYHGASLGALSISSGGRNLVHYTVDDWTARILDHQDDPNFSKARQLIEKIGPEKIAGICLETVSGTSGVSIAPQVWWDEVQKACKEYDFFLILDEVLAGFYRTGKPMAFHHYGIKPDFVCMAKAMSSGYFPVGAVWTTEEIYQYYATEALQCGLTNYAHPIGLATVKATLRYYEDRKSKLEIAELVKLFADRLNKFEKSSKCSELRQIGLLARLSLNVDLPTYEEFLKAGIFILYRDNHIFLAPPLVSTKSELNLAFDALEKVLGV